MSDYQKVLGFNRLIRELNNTGHELAFHYLCGYSNRISKVFDIDVIEETELLDNSDNVVVKYKVKIKDGSTKRITIQFIGRNDLYIERNIKLKSALPTLEESAVPENIFIAFKNIFELTTDDDRLKADVIIMPANEETYLLQVIYHNYKRTSVHITVESL